MSTELTAPNKIEADPIGTALIAAGVTSAAIESLAKDYGALAAQTQPIETPEEYEIIKRAQLAHRDIRTAVTAALKSERDEAVKYQKFVIQEEKRILAQIATTEEPLKKLREDYDNREMLRQQEEAKAWAEKMNLRKQAAFDIGYYFNGQAYLLDRENGEAPWVLREDQIAGMAMSDEALYALLEAQEAELKVTREIKAEAEAKAQDERLKAEAAQKAEADRIAAAQAELARKEQEMAEREKQMAARLLKSRTDAIQAVGGAQHGDGGWGWLEFRRSSQEILDMDDAAFAAFHEGVHDARLEWDTDQELLREKKEQERLAREEALKAEAAQKAVEEERSRAAAEIEARKEQEALLAQEEHEKALMASDRDKVIAFGTKVASLTGEIPEMKSAVAQHAMKTLRKQLTDIVTMLAKLEL